jgi:hypothetical protein
MMPANTRTALTILTAMAILVSAGAADGDTVINWAEESMDVTASGYHGELMSPEKTVDGYSDTDYWHMWLHSEGVVAGAWIEWDLAEVYELSRLHVWNCNQVYQDTPYTNRGIRLLNIALSEDGVTWRTIEGVEFPQAAGENDDPGFDVYFPSEGETARYVRFEILDNFSADTFGDYVGLSEIAFFELPEPCTLVLLSGGMLVLLRRRR